MTHFNRTSKVAFGDGAVTQGLYGAMRKALVVILPVAFLVGCHSEAETGDFDGSIHGLEARFADVNGVRTRYYDVGSGDPLVLVHGSAFRGTASANTWAPVIPLLASRFRVIAADALGAGLTGNPARDEDYDMEGMVQHLHDLVQSLDLAPIHLLGQSTGGGTAFMFAVTHPELVKTLTIVNSNTASPVLGETDRAEALAHCPSEPWQEEWLCIHRGMSFNPDHMDDEEFVSTAFEMEASPLRQETARKREEGVIDWRDDFAEHKETVYQRIMNEDVLTMPTLLYWGSSDPSAMLNRGLALYEIISKRNPDVRMAIVNQAGHFFWREHPDEFAYTVADFIDYWDVD